MRRTKTFPIHRAVVAVVTSLDVAHVLERTENPSYGSIQAGKFADLVLLDGDSTADIYNTERIHKVMKRGSGCPDRRLKIPNLIVEECSCLRSF